MNDAAENVPPELLEKIHHARSLSGQAWEQPFTPYASVGTLLAERAAATPDKTFLTFYDGETRAASYTYTEFFLLVRRAASFWRQTFGIQAGDRIATLRTNDPETVTIYFAAWLLGATVVPMNVGEDDARIAYILENSGARLVCGMESQRQRFADLKLPSAPHGLFSTAHDGLPEYASLDSITTEPISLDDLPPVAPDREALIVYTSGTTGSPKGVVLDHANLLADARSISEWHGFTPNDKAMNVLPLHHVNGIIVTLMTPLYSGGSVVLNRKFSVQHFWQTLAAEQCTWCSVVPTILAYLGERGENISQYDLSRFRHIVCGAGPLTVELARRFDAAFHVRVVHGYGLSETTCYSSFLPIDLPPEKYAYWMFECGFPSIGCPISANEMAIHDGEGNALPAETRGEIVIRGHNVMRYYFRRPDANAETFRYGWFRSGDEGFFRRGEDGQEYYFITGRIKELIIRGGVNVSPFDIDEVLNAISGVRAAMSVGFENNFYGEEIGAYVQLEPGAKLDEAEIIRQCREKLPFARCPKVVLFGEDFPVTSTGKYQRNKLKPLFAAWNDTQFRETK